jgi:hypothetical protein
MDIQHIFFKRRASELEQVQCTIHYSIVADLVLPGDRNRGPGWIRAVTANKDKFDDRGHAIRNGPGGSCGTLLLIPRWRWTVRSIMRRAWSQCRASCVIGVRGQSAGRAGSRPLSRAGWGRCCVMWWGWGRGRACGWPKNLEWEHGATNRCLDLTEKSETCVCEVWTEGCRARTIRVPLSRAGPSRAGDSGPGRAGPGLAKRGTWYERIPGEGGWETKIRGSWGPIFASRGLDLIKRSARFRNHLIDGGTAMQAAKSTSLQRWSPFFLLTIYGVKF